MAVKPLPVVILAGSALAGGGGAVAGAVGGVQIGRAQLQMRHNAARYERRYDSHGEQVMHTNEALRAFGQKQENAQCEVIFRMRDFLERHEKQVRAHAHLIIAGVDGSTPRIVGAARLDRDVAGWVGGVTGSIAVGAATPAALRKAVTSQMKASTGTAISSLHGAAKESATRAALGGGSLEAGGGGMSLGGTVLRAAPVGTGLLIAGLAVKNRGTKHAPKQRRTGQRLMSPSPDSTSATNSCAACKTGRTNSTRSSWPCPRARRARSTASRPSRSTSRFMPNSSKPR